MLKYTSEEQLRHSIADHALILIEALIFLLLCFKLVVVGIECIIIGC